MTVLSALLNRKMLLAMGCGLLLFVFALLTASAWAQAKPAASPSPIEQVRQGFDVAQACEVEIDDDLSAYGDCIGHAKDRMTSQRLALLGLHFQAWLIADLAARQASTRSLLLRQRYSEALTKGLRQNKWSLEQLCKAKNMVCEPIRLRMQQKIGQSF